MDIKELRDQMGRAYEAGEAIVREAGEKGWDDDRTAAFEKSHKEVREIQKTIQAAQLQADIRADMLDNHESRLDITKATESQAMVKAVERDVAERGSYRRFLKYCREGWGGLTTEDLMLYQAECRALGVGTEAGGGFLVPEDMMNSITSAILDFGGMRQARTTILRTRSGQPLNIPQNDDTANVGIILAENAAASEDDPVFAELVLGAFKYTSNVVRVSLELLDDNEIDNFESFLGTMLGTRIGRIQNTHFTVGAGTTEPVGVVPASTEGHETAATQVDTILKDDIIDLIHSVDPGYAPRAEFMMNYTTLGELRKLADTDGLPIWNDVQLNTPARLYGHPIVVNQDMASAAATTIPILFGDFSLYLIRDVWPIRVTRTTELFWLESQIGLMALARADGNLNDAGTAPIKHLLMVAA